MDYNALETLFHGPVTTSATGSPQRDIDVPVTMSIVTADEIRRSGARDIIGVLRHVPDVDTLQWGSDNSDVSIRGFNQPFSSGTLVMIDGRDVYADYYGFIPWSALPVELGAIRQIEVVKGPNSALFGFNAADGVINIITYNPRYDDTNIVTLRAGDPSLGEISGVATMRLGSDGGLRLSGGFRRNDEFSTGLPATPGSEPRHENQRAAVDADLVYAFGPGIEVTLEASHSDAAVNEMSPSFALQASRYQTNSASGRVTAESAIGMLQFFAYSNWIAWKGGSSTTVAIPKVLDRVTEVHVEDVVSLGSEHTVRLAAEYRQNETDIAQISGSLPTREVWSGSAMWQWQITPVLTATTALRFDQLVSSNADFSPPDNASVTLDGAKAFGELSYNFGLVWSADEEDSFRLTVSRGLELPSLGKSGALLAPIGTTDNRLPPMTPPMVLDNYEIAWDREFAAIDTRLQIALFHESRINVSLAAGASQTEPSLPLPEVVDESRAWGLAANVSGNIGSSWHWSLGYRYETIAQRFQSATADGPDFVGFQGTTPQHLVKAGAGWSDGRWEADGFLSWQSRTGGSATPSNAGGINLIDTSPMQEPVGSFAAVDARIAYKLADWATLQVAGQNLLQRRQKQTVGPEVGRQIALSLTFTK